MSVQPQRVALPGPTSVSRLCKFPIEGAVRWMAHPAAEFFSGCSFRFRCPGKTREPACIQRGKSEPCFPRNTGQMLQLQRQHRAVVRIRKKHEQEWCPDTVRNVFRDSARKEPQPFIVAYRGYAPAFCDIDRIRKCDSLRLHSRASARHGSWSSLRSHEKVSSCEPPFFPWFGIQIDGVSSMELRFLTCKTAIR